MDCRSSNCCRWIFAAVSAFTKKGDSVMIMRPVYGPFRFAIEFNERVMTDVPLISDQRNNYSIDFEKFESECKKSENKMVILCNPHNPGGILWSKDDLEKVIKIANDNDVIVVVDEIWQDIVMPGNTHTSVLSLDRKLIEKQLCVNLLQKLLTWQDFAVDIQLFPIPK